MHMNLQRNWTHVMSEAEQISIRDSQPIGEISTIRDRGTDADNTDVFVQLRCDVSCSGETYLQRRTIRASEQVELWTHEYVIRKGVDFAIDEQQPTSV